MIIANAHRPSPLQALQYSMFICCAVNVFGAIFFFINALFITKDKETCDALIREGG